MASQLCGFLDETDYLDPFQFGFRPDYGTETILVTFVDDLYQELDRKSVSLLVLLDLSVAFSTIDHGMLMAWLSGTGDSEVAIYDGSGPSWRGEPGG